MIVEVDLQQIQFSAYLVRADVMPVTYQEPVLLGQ